MSVTIYGFGRSRALRAVWAAEEAGRDYTFSPLNAAAGEHRQPAYLAINPGGKVPALVEGDFVLTESGAIVSYLGAGTPLTPSAPQDRARFDQWCFFACTELEQPLWTIGKHKFALPRDWRVPAIFETCGKEFARAAKVFAEGLGEKTWILGETFTMADVLLGHTLFWANAFKLPLAHDNLVAYRERAWARPARERAYAVKP